VDRAHDPESQEHDLAPARREGLAAGDQRRQATGPHQLVGRQELGQGLVQEAVDLRRLLDQEAEAVAERGERAVDVDEPAHRAAGQLRREHPAQRVLIDRAVAPLLDQAQRHRTEQAQRVGDPDRRRRLDLLGAELVPALDQDPGHVLVQLDPVFGGGARRRGGRSR
jgi:hypothetical protein